MKALLLGASGFVGGYILDEALANRIDARVLIRRGSEKKLRAPEKIEIVHGDPFDIYSLTEAMSGVDVTINLIGIIREFPNRAVTFERVHVESIRSIVAAAETVGMKRLIHMSANGASRAGVSDYQTTKRRAEELIEKSSLEATIFRPSVIFGDARGSMEFTSELAKVIGKAPLAPIFGDGLYELEPVAVEDVARVFIQSIFKPETRGSTYHLGGTRRLTFLEIAETIARAVTGSPLKSVKIPLGLIHPLARLMGRFSFFPISADQLNMLLEGNCAPESAWVEVFDCKPREFNVENLAYLGQGGTGRRKATAP